MFLCKNFTYANFNTILNAVHQRLLTEDTVPPPRLRRTSIAWFSLPLLAVCGSQLSVDEWMHTVCTQVNSFHSRQKCDEWLELVHCDATHRMQA